MTITVVGLGAQNNPSSNNVSSMTLAEPAGSQEGDLLVGIMSYITSATGVTASIPAGWTLIRNDFVSDTAVRRNTIMAYIERGAATPADRTFTISAGQIGVQGIMVGLRSSRGKVFYDTSAGESEAAATAAVSSAGFTTARANSVLVMACATDGNQSISAQGAATDPTSGSWTEQTEFTSPSAIAAHLAIATASKATAGATGNLSYTASASGEHAISTAAFYEEYWLRADTGTFSFSGQAVEDPAGILHQYIGGTTFTPPAGGSTVSLTNVPAGAADAERRLLIGVIHRNGSGGSNPANNLVTNMTVEGAAATRLTEAGTSQNASWWLTDKIPTGTDVDIDITTNASISLGANIFGKIHVYRLINARATPLDTLADTGSSGSDDPTGTIDEARFGVNVILTLGGLYATTAATHAQPSGYVEDSETAEISPGDSFRVANSVASKWNGAAATNVTTSVNVTNGTGSSSAAISMVVVALSAQGADPVITIDGGSYTYTGQDVILRVARRLPVDFGSFSHNGQAVSLLTSRRLAADFGSYTYNGQDVDLRHTYPLAIDAGLFSILGQDVVLTYHPHWEWSEESAIVESWAEQVSLTSTWVEETPLSSLWTEES